jgi:hypothetical protein
VYGAEETTYQDITESEIGTIVIDLANRKAPGCDGPTNEHRRHCGINC